MKTMKLLALVALAASLYSCAKKEPPKQVGAAPTVSAPAAPPPQPEPTRPATAAKVAPPAKPKTLTKDQQLELLGVIAESEMLSQQADASQAVVAAKAAIQRRNEAVDRVRLAIGCKTCGFNVENGKISVLEPPH